MSEHAPRRRNPMSETGELRERRRFGYSPTLAGIRQAEADIDLLLSRLEAAERRAEALERSAIVDGALVETGFGSCPDCDCDMDLYRRGEGWAAKCCGCEREATAESLTALRYDVAWGWITPEQLVELEVAERRLADLYAAIVLAAEIIAYNRRASRAGGET